MAYCGWSTCAYCEQSDLSIGQGFNEKMQKNIPRPSIRELGGPLNSFAILGVCAPSVLAIPRASAPQSPLQSRGAATTKVVAILKGCASQTPCNFGKKRPPSALRKCVMIIVHACIMIVVNAYVKIIVHACSILSMLIAHACITTIVRAFTVQYYMHVL